MTNKSITPCLICCLWCCIALEPVQAANLRVVIKLLTSFGAAESLSRASKSLHEYVDGKSTLRRLEEQGVDCDRGAIYSVSFDTTAGFWADWFSKPDVYFVVQIEGEGSFLVPQIYNNYSGGHILERVIAREAKPGSKVVVRVLDDDSSSDVSWNALLPKSVRLDLSSTIQAVKLGIPISAGADGKIHMELHGVDSKLVLDAPDEIAEAVIQLPSVINEGWVAHGRLYDSDGEDVGAIDVSPVWLARNDPAYFSLGRRVPLLLSSAIFWGIVGICAIAWFFKAMFSTELKSIQDNENNSAG